MLTLGEARARLSSLSPPAELDNRINEAVELLSTSINTKDSQVRVAFTVSNGILSLPQEFSGLVGVSVDGVPRPIYNGYYEFLGSGPGVVDAVYTEVVDIGDNFACIRDIVDIDPDGCLLKIKIDDTESCVVLLRGIDENSEAVRTDSDGLGTWIDGEEVAPTEAGDTTSTVFLSLDQIVKPVTKTRIRVYAIDPDDASEILISVVEAGNTQSCFRRYRVLKKTDNAGDDESYTVTALVRRRPTDARADSDILPISNMNALRSAMRALEYLAANDVERYDSYLANALRILDKEAGKFRPANTFPAPVQVQRGTGWASGIRSIY